MLDRFAFELKKVEQEYERQGLSDEEIRSRIRDLEIRIQEIIDGKMRLAISSAVEEGIRYKAVDFLRELRPAPGAFKLETTSHRTDFSIPPFNMKNSLLKNAKISKDGTRYKVIPVGKKSNTNPFDLNMSQLNMSFSSDEVYKATAEALKAKLKERTSSIGINSTAHKEFKTVSDKQPRTSWQHPGFNRDMTSSLEEINKDLEQSIESEVKGLISAELKESAGSRNVNVTLNSASTNVPKEDIDDAFEVFRKRRNEEE